MPDDLTDMQGRVAIVTGASRGIGLAIATELRRRGALVCLTARKDGQLQDAARGLGDESQVIAVAGAADDPVHRSEAVSRTMTTFGRVDMLVNNIGVNPVYGPLITATGGATGKVFDVNVVSALEWVKLVHEAWMGDNGGSIVNVASAAGLRPAAGIGVYGASKAALLHLTEQLAWELAPGVRVNAVAPAVVETRFAAALYEGRVSEVVSAYPMKRLGRPEDVAAGVTYLLSDSASWVTGQTLVIDGGLSLTGGIQ